MPSTLADTGPGSPVELVIRRIRETADQVGDLFPLHADPVTGHWTTTRRGSWAGGFWAGLLWMAADVSGDAGDRARAAAVTARLAGRAADDTDTRALTFWYGAARGSLLCADPTAAEVARQGAVALAESVHPLYGVIPAGTGLGRGASGASKLTVDAAGAVVSLLSWAARSADRPELGTLALRHATAVLERCLAGDGGVRAAAPQDPAALDPAGEEAEPAGEWPRGQAWGMLAFAESAALAGDDTDRAFLEAACLATDFWLDRTGGGVPPWSFTDPGGPRDTSAGTIAAEAMLVLSGVADGTRGPRYRDAAVRLLRELVTRHLTPPDAGAGPPPGMLLDGCYDMASGTAVSHELIWGDYFLLSALLRLRSGEAPAAGR